MTFRRVPQTRGLNSDKSEVALLGGLEGSLYEVIVVGRQLGMLDESNRVQMERNVGGKP